MLGPRLLGRVLRDQREVGAIEDARLVPVVLVEALQEERDVLRLRYGLDDGQARTIASVGKLVGRGVGAVRNTEQRALKKLRRPCFISRLESFEYDF